MGENGRDHENDDKDEDADEVDDDDDGVRSESSESSEDTVKVARKRKCSLFKIIQHALISIDVALFYF